MNREYMDKGICALDGGMICFSDHRETVRVPARAGDMPLHRLGSGALCLAGDPGGRVYCCLRPDTS